MRLSCQKLEANAVRLQLYALAYNRGNFTRALALPELVGHWSLPMLCKKLVKIRAKVVSNGRSINFQLTEVAVPRGLFADILDRTDRLRPKPVPT